MNARSWTCTRSKVDPVFRDRDVASYTSGNIPTDILELMDLERQVLHT